MPKFKIIFLKTLTQLQFFFHVPDLIVVETRQILSQQKNYIIAHSEINSTILDQELSYSQGQIILFNCTVQ